MQLYRRIIASGPEVSEHIEFPHEVEMTLQVHRLAVGGLGTKFMVEDVSHIHSGMPQRRSFDGPMKQATIMVDLAKFMVTVKLLDCSQLATPPVSEEKGYIVKVHAYCW